MISFHKAVDARMISSRTSVFHSQEVFEFQKNYGYLGGGTKEYDPI